jgi:hypothetical protein
MSNMLIPKFKNVLLAILIAALLIGVLPLSPVKAQGIAISGSFYRHHFQLLPGETLNTPDIYVVVFNHSDEATKIKLSTRTPTGVSIILERSEFAIQPKGQEQVTVGVSISKEATPGDYVIGISADVLPEEGTGIAIVGSAEQEAKLTIFGEAGELHITTVTVDNEPFRAEVHLYQKLEGKLNPAGYSDTGEFRSRLVPGDYMVQAFYQDNEVAKEEFTLEANEMKELILVAQTVFIYGFSAVPSYDSGKGEISFAKIVYTVKNVYQPLKDVQAILKVSLNGNLLEEVPVVSVPTLDTGNTAGSYNFIPSAGWENGNYNFRLEVFSQEKLYATSPQQIIEVKADIVDGVNWLLIILLLILLGLSAVAIMWLLKRKKQRLGVAKGIKPSSIKPEEEAVTAQETRVETPIPDKEPLRREKTGTKADDILADETEPRGAHNVVFDIFEVVPISDSSTGELSSIRINYGLINQQDPLPNITLELQIEKNGAPLEVVPLIKLTSLKQGRGRSNHDYIPTEGWQKHTEYLFRLALYSDSKLYAVTDSKSYLS